MARAFTQYWSSEWLDDLEEFEVFEHTAGNLFVTRGLEAGDRLYLVSSLEGRMVLISGGVVDGVMDRDEAVELLENDELWAGEDHVIIRQGTGHPLAKRIVKDDVVKALRFVSEKNGEQPLKFTSNGRLDQQTLRGVRQMSEASADMLDRLLEETRQVGRTSQAEGMELGAAERTVERATKQYAPHCIYHIMASSRLEDFLQHGGRGEFTEMQSWRTSYHHWRATSEQEDYLIFFDHAEEFVGVGWVARIEAIDIQQLGKGEFSTKVVFSGLRRLSAPFDKTQLRLASDGRPVDANYLKGYLPCHTPADVASLLANVDVATTSGDDDEVYEEGTEVMRLHRQKERNPQLVTRAKELWSRRPGGLQCEVCAFDFNRVYGLLGHGFIEAHHRRPLAELDGPIEVTVDDLAPVCANCHRMLHRESGLTVQTLKARMNEQMHSIQ